MTAVADTTTGKPRFASISGVEIFCVGVHKGKPYTVDDLNQMVTNFNDDGVMVDPTLAVGHEEQQELLANTGWPAAGKVTDLYRDGDSLYADFTEIPLTFAKFIEHGAYRKVSAEVYDDFVDAEGVSHGKTLRRVSLLGAEVPEIKSLADLPAPDYGIAAGDDGASTPAFRSHRKSILKLSEVCETQTKGIYRIFCEVVPMKKKSKPAKNPVMSLAKFSEKAKQTFRKFADEPVDTSAGAAPPSGVDRAAMVDMLSQIGFDAAVLTDAVPDNVLAEFIRVWQAQEGPQEGAQMSATPPIAPATAPVVPAANPAPANSGILPTSPPTSMTLKFSEEVNAAVTQAVAAALAPITAQLATAKNEVATFQGQTKKAMVDKFCEDMTRAGKILPRENDEGVLGKDGTLRARLLRANSIEKFSDGQSELDLQMNEIRNRPNLVKYSEQVRVGKDGSVIKAGDDSDPEVQAVAQFAEQRQADLLKCGKTTEQFVKAFKTRRLKDPEFTALKYTGISA